MVNRVIIHLTHNSLKEAITCGNRGKNNQAIFRSGQVELFYRANGMSLETLQTHGP